MHSTINDPIISICIPTYERPEYLKRLLESIKIQKFRDFEVIITDDSKTDIIQSFLNNYNTDFAFRYYKNLPSLGTARNMVEGRKHAKAKWIKIIHDDDFFATETALEKYANAISLNTRFIFSGYNTYIENTGEYINRTITQKKFMRISENPLLLFANNFIGTPSVMMFHKDVEYLFEEHLKWFTDIEYYIRILHKEKAVYIDDPLVNVTSNDTQITTYTRNNPLIVIPEALYLMNFYGNKSASNLYCYDSWWRMFRNMNIRTVGDLEKYNINNVTIPLFVLKILRQQRAVPLQFIKIGFVSKLCMSFSFAINKIKKII